MINNIRKAIPFTHRYFVSDATYINKSFKFGLIHAYGNTIIGKNNKGFPNLMSVSSTLTFRAFFKLAKDDEKYMKDLLSYKGNKLSLYKVTIKYITKRGVRGSKEYLVRAKTRFEVMNLNNVKYITDSEVFNENLQSTYVDNVEVLINKQNTYK